MIGQAFNLHITPIQYLYQNKSNEILRNSMAKIPKIQSTKTWGKRSSLPFSLSILSWKLSKRSQTESGRALYEISPVTQLVWLLFMGNHYFQAIAFIFFFLVQTKTCLKYREKFTFVQSTNYLTLHWVWYNHVATTCILRKIRSTCISFLWPSWRHILRSGCWLLVSI